MSPAPLTSYLLAVMLVQEPQRGEKIMTTAEDLLAEITDPSMRERLSSIRQGIQERQKRQTQKPKSAEIVQLPLWPEPARGVPNSALRGALFAAIQGKDRKAMERKVLAVQKGIQICFTGIQLNQSDLDVWEQALHLARMHPLGTRCEFTAHAFLKALGRSTGKAQHEDLKKNFARLGGCLVEITHNRLTYGGSLLEFYRDEDTGRYHLEVNSKINALYNAGWTATDWQQRKALSRKPLALWLHGFYASHADPYPVSVEKLREWSGSRNKQLAGFKRKLKAALEDLKAIGAILDFEIKDGLVYVKRAPSRSQQKHLTRTKPRKK